MTDFVDEGMRLASQNPPVVGDNTPSLSKSTEKGLHLAHVYAVAREWQSPTTQVHYEALRSHLQAREDRIVELEKALAWQPEFDAISVEQEELVRRYCAEIAGPRGKKGSPPDPVCLLEMAQALYEAEYKEFGPKVIAASKGEQG